ncbi:MAG: ydjXC [bacterium]|nr:MAG: ydjXC [bacterium]KAF0147351.1 MAG: ydjXC [bacterium]KAF0165529.1 MAG: ydjXC [bacterium]TXT17066.1 MAG: ydjXC [bacterium]
MSKTLPRILIGLALLAAIAAAILYRDHFDAAALQAWVDGAGVAGPLLFMAVYALAAVLFLPGSVLTLAGGALFGPFWGTLWNLTGATIGASLAFLIARYLGSDWVTRKAGPRLQSLNDGVSAEGWRFVAFVRLVPLFPFNLLNYALGLTRIPFLAYVLASWVFMLPGALAYTWLGHAGREALAGGEGMVRNVLIALALLAAVAFLPRLVRKLRQPAMLPVEALKQDLDTDADVLVLDVRPSADFTGEQGHIAGALSLPLEELPSRLAELEDRKTRPIRLVCRTDRRSAQAARLLAEAGFADARVIRGGMTAWRGRGWPVEDESR